MRCLLHAWSFNVNNNGFSVHLTRWSRSVKNRYKTLHYFLDSLSQARPQMPPQLGIGWRKSYLKCHWPILTVSPPPRCTKFGVTKLFWEMSWMLWLLTISLQSQSSCTELRSPKCRGYGYVEINRCSSELSRRRATTYQIDLPDNCIGIGGAGLLVC